MRGRPMTTDALKSPEQNPAAYPVRSPAPNNVVSMFASLALSRGQAPLQQRVPAQAATPAAGAQQQAGGMDYISIPTASQQKFSIQNFDGTELYRGLSSVLLDYGRTFVRAIKLSRSSCGFLWSEDVKVGLLSHFLSGTAERYSHKQVDTQ
uniref:Uncharacterized protein n=1 Tax=Peronospora matthiolae TaxID=2874970 RepID=A0AAV1VBA4_9STRA